MHKYRCGKSLFPYVCSRARHARFFSSEDAPGRILKHNKISSSASVAPIDGYLILQARRSTFVPPLGYSMSDCANRLEELVNLDMISGDEMRLGKVLLLTNAILSISSPSKKWIGDVRGYVRSSIEHRSRFSNVFTLIQYMRFISKLESSPASLAMMLNTLQRSREVNVSECIEIIYLLLKTKALTTGEEYQVCCLLRYLTDVLQSTTDEKGFSEGSKAHAFRVSEYFFGEFLDKDIVAKRPILEDLLRLFFTVMRGRHCASPVCLEKLISVAIFFKDEVSDRAKTIEILSFINDTQLSRFSEVKHLFLQTPVLWDSLRTLSGYTNIALAPLSSPDSSLVSSCDSMFFGIAGKEIIKQNSFDGTYVRQPNDFNDYPLFKNGKFWLYFSKLSDSWQIGPDPKRDLLRLAYLPSLNQSRSFPLARNGWHVYSPRKKSFIPSSHTFFAIQSQDSSLPVRTLFKSRSTSIALSADSPFEEFSAFPDAQEPPEESLLGKWTSATHEPHGNVSNNEKLRSLEIQVSSLQQKLDAIMQDAKDGTCSKNQPTSSVMELLRSVARAVAATIDSVWLGKDAMSQVPSLSSRSFESLRSEQIALDRLELQRKKIAREFR